LSVLEKVRRWIDGDNAETVLEEAARDAQVKPRSQAEEFIVKIARAVEEVMQKELVPLPQGTTIIPSEYIIFLSEEDDKEWQGVKRRGLEQGLYHILAERAREIAGKRKLETKSFVIELRVDGTQEKGEVRVQHGWEDSATGKTGVLPRLPKKDPVAGPQASATSVPPQYVPPPPTFTSNTSPSIAQHTIQQNSFEQATPLKSDEAEVMTSVRKRAKELYKLEVFLNGVRQTSVPVFENEISIGRGSKSKPVTIKLPGDPEISRRHLTISTDGEGRFWVVNEGRNPAIVNNIELPTGQRISLSPGVNLNVCSYTLRIQSR
jgi:pSer/pThr/pTyr-binding forkhead associated (FHA) protein